MYGHNLGVRSDAPSEPIFTKLCVLVHVPDMFLSFEFQKDRVKYVGAVGVEISPLPLKRHIASTTACCYRTSRDKLIHVCSYAFYVIAYTILNKLLVVFL